MMPGNRGSRARIFHGIRLWQNTRFTMAKPGHAAFVAAAVHPFFASHRPLVFAHRGGSHLAPENTLAAFDNGLALGADGLELDVHLSRDGQVVVHHDTLLDRTTDATGPIASRTAAELRSVDAGHRFARDGAWPYRGRGISVPTLADVLARYSAARIIIELKVNRREMAEAAVEVVRASGAIDRVCLGSFGTRVMRAARRLERRLATSAGREEVRWALYRSWVGWAPGHAGYQAFQVPEWTGTTRVVSPRFVRLAHAAGLFVQVWTVDTEDDTRRLLDMGVDALITDRPDIVVPAVRHWVKERG